MPSGWYHEHIIFASIFLISNFFSFNRPFRNQCRTLGCLVPGLLGSTPAQHSSYGHNRTFTCESTGTPHVADLLIVKKKNKTLLRLLKNWHSPPSSRRLLPHAKPPAFPQSTASFLVQPLSGTRFRESFLNSEVCFPSTLVSFSDLVALSIWQSLFVRDFLFHFWEAVATGTRL